MRGNDQLNDLRLGDVVTFLEVQRCGSITGAARALKVTPSQVSKAVARLEQQLRVVLLTRSSRGVGVSDAGRRIIPHLEDVLGRLRGLSRSELEAAQLTVAGASYLISIFLPRIAEAQPQLRVRGLELPPPLVRAHAAENRFDLALIVGKPRLPGAWSMVAIGDVRKALFASPSLARKIGALPTTVDRIRTVPFIGPIQTINGQYVPADDDCPLAHDQRQLGHEVQTIGVALELAARTEQLVFGPVIAARRLLDAGGLCEIPVKGWSASEPLFLVCNGDRVMAAVQRALFAALRRGLAEVSNERSTRARA